MDWSYVSPAVGIANLDHKGFAEIVVGRHVLTVEHDANGKLVFLDHFAGALMNGTQQAGPTVCISNIAGDEGMEIVAGTTVYRMPTPPAGVTKIADCAVGATDNFCTGKLDVIWDGQTVNGAVMIPALSATASARSPTCSAPTRWRRPALPTPSTARRRWS